VAIDTPPEDYDVVLIGGGVAGYVAAIKAGQEGMKVWKLRDAMHS
jgi:dihydrolipoamide dehydrogenase